MHPFNVLLVLALLLPAGIVAAEDKALDVTIKVIESPGDSPSTVTKTIQLPAAAKKAREQESTNGREPASGDKASRSLDEREKMRSDDRKTAAKKKTRADEKMKKQKQKQNKKAS